MSRLRNLGARLAHLPARGVIALVRLYQLTLSPFVGGHCRYVPTCSEYFIQAVGERGFWIGSAKGIWRLLRCHPFARGGYDPVYRHSLGDETGQASLGRQRRDDVDDLS